MVHGECPCSVSKKVPIGECVRCLKPICADCVQNTPHPPFSLIMAHYDCSFDSEQNHIWSDKVLGETQGIPNVVITDKKPNKRNMKPNPHNNIDKLIENFNIIKEYDFIEASEEEVTMPVVNAMTEIIQQYHSLGYRFSNSLLDSEQSNETKKKIILLLNEIFTSIEKFDFESKKIATWLVTLIPYRIFEAEDEYDDYNELALRHLIEWAHSNLNSEYVLSVLAQTILRIEENEEMVGRFIADAIFQSNDIFTVQLLMSLLCRLNLYFLQELGRLSALDPNDGNRVGEIKSIIKISITEYFGDS